MTGSLRGKFIGDKAFYRMVLAIAVPIMIQNGITNFVSMLDNIMVGQVGTEQMSGVAIVNQLIFVYNLCIFGGLSGAGIFTAQYFGQEDAEGIRHTFRYKIWMGLILTILAIGIFLFAGGNLIQLYLDGRQQRRRFTRALPFRAAPGICTLCFLAFPPLWCFRSMPVLSGNVAKPLFP